MAACPACGKENPGGFEFCGFCGAPLREIAPARSLEERKVVSVLFCDLVGFTAASEAVDPEDVRARLRPYHERLRRELEAYGGTVEKFVGDAVMAVFGAPVAHEDDAERAVRAGLRVVEAIGELNEADPGLDLQVRVGVNTGEALVALQARPQLGEGIVAGDVVNTASRLQGVAPVDGVVVSEATFRATERVFEWEPLEPVRVKGKSEPVTVFRPLKPKARFGSDVTRAHTTPLVGRELEKPLLVGVFERAAKQRSCQLVTVVGEPGVGKSRLCMELFQHIEERPDLTRWRQGRCLPYGEGISFWALGEIVKAEAGILESDSPETAAAKLEQALPQDDPDLPWLRARVQPLVGTGGEPASQQESFTAWRRLLESWAAHRETVLVFEDLHWADDALLAFLEHLADWAEGVPLLVLCTARPELYEQHQGWAGGLRNAHTINLPPLTDEETATLVSSLLEQTLLPADTQRMLLERAGGNPLYAEEFVRLLADRGFGNESPVVPEGVQALIAARLDTLTADRKSLLQDAAVVGKVFWAEALAEIGGRDLREVELALHELSRKELVRPARTTSMEGEAEYGFWHGLVRDVCYAQIPRAARSARHRAAAAWIEAKARERVEDLADVLAYHYLQAFELADAAGQHADREELETRAIHYFALAGERALALDVGRAEAGLAHALALAPPDHPERASLLVRWAEAAQQQGRFKEAREALESALGLYRQQGEKVASGRAMTALANVLRVMGDPVHEETIAEALVILEAQPPGPDLVAAYGQLASGRTLGGAYHEAIAAAERSLALATELGLPVPARALGYRGISRAYVGEREGLDDMRAALVNALEQGQGRESAVLHNNLAVALWQYDGPQAALDTCREGIDFCERHGITEYRRAIAAMSTTMLAELAQTETALSEAGPLAESMEAAGDIDFIEPRSVQVRLLVERGAPELAPAVDALVVRARESGEPQVLALAFSAAARLALAQGRPEDAKASLQELEAAAGLRADAYYASVLPTLVRAAIALEDAALSRRLVDGVEPLKPLAAHALVASHAQLAEADGKHAEAAKLYADAAGGWRRFGNVPESAYALLGQGRCLVLLRDTAAEVPLAEARDLFASMGYKPALAGTEKLLATDAA